MKNILLLSTLYPSDDVRFLNNTAVCHYFAKEWQKLGYKVRVFFLYNTFPRYYYPLLKFLNKTIANKSGIAVLDKYLPYEHNYTIDDIKVTRLSVKKSRPGGSYKQDDIVKISNRIIEILQKEAFTPDIILSHFLHPSIDVISNLKKTYDVPTSVSLHGKERVFSEETERNLNTVDYMGYRSYPIRNCFEKLYGEKEHFFCFSGVPSEYIVERPREFSKKNLNFIYVGSLIKRKHPTCLIPAISNVFKEESYSITYVGDGAEKNSIVKVSEKNKCRDKVLFTGRINRDDVTKELDKADIFIMLSSDETFGLVYLEAMARGCIVIASTDEGMDGIIRNGENGFLCKAGDSIELEKTLNLIKNLDANQLKKISEAGLETARKMTDTRMAEEYINFFIKKNNVKR